MVGVVTVAGVEILDPYMHLWELSVNCHKFVWYMV